MGCAEAIEFMHFLRYTTVCSRSALWHVKCRDFLSFQA